jgi:uncharacterized protein
VKAAEDRKISVFLSEEIAAELSQVLGYPKIEKVYRPELTRQQLIEQVLKIGKFVKATSKLMVVQEHPADNKFLECAIAANADYIVSGDRHLLNIVSYKTIKILPVTAFVELLKGRLKR